MGYRLGTDVGGTFTDFILVRPDGEVVLDKVPTTPGDESAAVMRGIGGLAEGEGLDVRTLLSRTDVVVHGTTTADNTMIQMNGAVTGLLTTEGHRDQIEIRRGFKERIWDPAYPPPPPIAPRRRRLGIPERLDFRGRVVTPLDEEATRKAIRRLKRQGVESVAVCLLFSFVSPAHERRVRELLAEELPAARVSLSHEVMPSAPEFERTSTTLVDAYVAPRVSRYVERLAASLREGGYGGELLLMQSNGGLATAEVVARRAVATLGSGPTGGVIGAVGVARAAGVEDFIAVDMGGTSYEVCLVRGGAPSVRAGWSWVQRYLVGLPMIEMHAIGAGGGSIAKVEAGALRVGPESAGAEPGPVCYGRGGREPTVTDANVVLGYLSPQALCGGALRLDAGAARAAVAHGVGEPLGLDAVTAAHGVFRLVNANMANAIRRVSCEKGLDPRAFTMVVYGGNGPVHAGKQAEELGIRKLIVPRTSPAFSALGLLMADHVVDRQRSHVEPAGRCDLTALSAILTSLADEAATELARAGIGRDAVRLAPFLCMSYPGQTFDVPVPVATSGGRVTREELDRAIDAFHARHEELRTYAVRDQEPVVRAARLQATGPTPKPRVAKLAEARGPASDAILARRPAYFDGRFVDTPVYDGARLAAGHAIEGPAIVEERFTTLVLYPGHRAVLTEQSNYEVTILDAGAGAGRGGT